MAKSKHTELEPDAWARFERAVDIVAKSPHSTERSESPASRAPALRQRRRLMISALAQRQSAKSTFISTLLRRYERMARFPFGPRRRNPYGLRLTSRRTNKPPFTSASAHFRRASIASSSPMSLPMAVKLSPRVLGRLFGSGMGCGVSNQDDRVVSAGLIGVTDSLIVGRFAMWSRAVPRLPIPHALRLGAPLLAPREKAFRSALKSLRMNLDVRPSICEALALDARRRDLGARQREHRVNGSEHGAERADAEDPTLIDKVA